ncbi:MAG TPA: N-acetylmuramoyl-L-alanine amidase, partial [Bacillota bacterium]|nr:N-acetylmuramoyl-L-alanine amidase [Bacillota bacterium]
MKVIVLSKRWLIVLWIIVAILLILVFLSQGQDSDYAMYTLPTEELVVVIDPGHGGFDSGALGPSGIREDVLNLQVAKKLEKLLNDNGAQTIMTRTDNDALAMRKADDMKKRVDIIKESSPDIVVSIHMNKFGQSKYYGAQTFYMAGSTEGERLAESVQVQLRENLIEGNNRQIKA